MSELLTRLGILDARVRPLTTLDAVDSLAGHAAVLDTAGYIRAINRHWRDFHAGSPGHVPCAVGDDYLEVCRRSAAAGSPDARSIADALQNVLDARTNESWVLHRRAAASGGDLYVTHIVRFELDREAHVLVAHENVTALLKRSNHAVELLAKVAERTATGVIITNADQRIEWVNESFTEMTGFDAVDAVGRRPGEFLQGDGSEGHALERVRRACRAGEPVAATLLNYRKSGEPFFVDLRIDPVRDADGELTHFIAVQVDVTALREREAELADALYVERARLAADIHDGLGQELTGAALLFSAALARLPPESASSEPMRRGLDALRRAQQMTRELAHGLAPAHLANGLRPALQALVDTLHVPGGLSARLDAAPELDVTGNVAHHLFRIAQEASTNAIKHGRPRHLVITLGRRNRSLHLSVWNDGDPFAPSCAEGLGLRTMRARAAQLHADLSIDVRDDGGTAVECTVPMPRLASHARSIGD